MDSEAIVKSEEEDHPDLPSPAVVLKLRSSLDQFKFTPPSTTNPTPIRRSSRLSIVKQEIKEEDGILPTVSASSSTSRVSRKRSASEVHDLEPAKRGRTRSSSPTKVKKGYAPPEMYAHLECLTDRLREELDIIFVGINPGVESAKQGAHFAHPTNHFWRCLHIAGFTDRRVPPTEEYILPEQYNIGLTDLVDRPSSEAAELSKDEKIAAVPRLLAKFSLYRPRFVCFVGKVIWDVVEPVLKDNIPSSYQDTREPDGEESSSQAKSGSSKKGGKSKGKKPPFPYHLPLAYKMSHDTKSASTVNETLFFVVPSTSGLVAGYQLADKARFFTAIKACLDAEKRGELDTSFMAPVRFSAS